MGNELRAPRAGVLNDGAEENFLEAGVVQIAVAGVALVQGLEVDVVAVFVKNANGRQTLVQYKNEIVRARGAHPGRR